MKIKDIPIEELELMSYTDMTYIILKENKKPMNTPEIFKKICELLEYSEDEYVAKIGDYYTSLTLDKRFLLLENNAWDIRDHHSVELVLDDDETEEIEVEEEIDEEFDEDIDSEDDVEIDEDVDATDLEDLAIVTDDEIEE